MQNICSQHVKVTKSHILLLEPFETDATGVNYMCYFEHNDAVVLSCWSPGRVWAIKLSDGSTLWEFHQQKNGKDIDRLGLCYDTDGRIYVAESNTGVITINSRTGELLLHLIKDVQYYPDVCWTSSQPQITLLYKYGEQISTFNVGECEHY